MSASIILPQPTPPPQTPAAALQLVQASLEALAAKLGQVLDATVLATGAQGLTQLKLGGETLTVKLSQPLPAGTQIQVAVQPSANGTPVLVMQPRLAVAVPPQTPLPLPLLAQASMTPRLITPSTVLQAQSPPPVSSSPVALPAGPIAVPAPSPTVQAPTPSATVQAPTVIPQSAPVVQTLAQPPVVQTLAQPIAPQPGGQPAPASAAAAAPMPAAGQAAAPTTAQPVAVLTTQPAAPSAAGPSFGPLPASVSPAASPAAVIANPVVAPSRASAAPAPTPSMPGTAPAVPTSAATPTSSPAVVPGSPHPTMPAAPGATAPSAAAVPSSPGPMTPAGTASAAAPQTQATAPMPRSAAPVAQQVPVTPGRPAAVSTLSLAQPAQAAARQDSLAPLLQNLGALQGRMAELPRPVAEAAVRLLSQRIPLNRGAPTGEAIRQAVMRSGVFLDPPAKAGAQPADVKSALLQLRTGLVSLIEGSEIAPVAPIGRKPPPPLREAQPRAIRGEAPSLSDNASVREVGRTLLNQTEAALSRLKLTQLASQPQDARSAAMAGPDFTVELPMLLGHELSIAQLQVQRDGKGKSKPGERGWRLRFAVSFSLIGEVGAQISLMAGTTNVVIWADEPATAEALAEMLPELAPALAARGLDVGAVRVRRGAPEAASPDAGRLMDQVR